MAKQLLNSNNPRIDLSNSVTARQYADEFFKDTQKRHDFMRPLYRQVFANCLKEFVDTDFANRVLGPYLGEFLNDIFHDFTCDITGNNLTYHVFNKTLSLRISCYAAVMAGIFSFLAGYARDYVYRRNAFEDLPF